MRGIIYGTVIFSGVVRVLHVASCHEHTHGVLKILSFLYRIRQNSRIAQFLPSRGTGLGLDRNRSRDTSSTTATKGGFAGCEKQQGERTRSIEQACVLRLRRGGIAFPRKHGSRLRSGVRELPVIAMGARSHSRQGLLRDDTRHDTERRIERQRPSRSDGLC